jgi:hypothetical protein
MRLFGAPPIDERVRVPPHPNPPGAGARGLSAAVGDVSEVGTVAGLLSALALDPRQQRLRGARRDNRNLEARYDGAREGARGLRR